MTKRCQQSRCEISRSQSAGDDRRSGVWIGSSSANQPSGNLSKTTCRIQEMDKYVYVNAQEEQWPREQSNNGGNGPPLDEPRSTENKQDRCGAESNVCDSTFSLRRVLGDDQQCNQARKHRSEEGSRHAPIQWSFCPSEHKVLTRMPIQHTANMLRASFIHPGSLKRPGFPGGSKPWESWSHGSQEASVVHPVPT